MVKEILNISQYSTFNCFSFFSGLKQFLISLIILYFSRLKLSIIICFEKNVSKKKKKNSIILHKKHSRGNSGDSADLR